jgi:hypothetical protein
MTTFDYKKYSLEKLEEWIHDTLNGDATPQEIYDVIKGVVDEQYHYHKLHASRCYELLALLNGNGRGHIKAYDDYVDNGMKPWGHSDLEYLTANKKKDEVEHHLKDGYSWTPLPKNDEVQKWRLPVQLEGLTGDLYVNLPDDLLEKVGWKEGDMVEYVPSENGFYVMRKVNGIK